VKKMLALFVAFAALTLTVGCSGKSTAPTGTGVSTVPSGTQANTQPSPK